MALFQRKPQNELSHHLYSVGIQRTILIAGLGNPGKQYDGTRHNIGFECVDEFVRKSELGEWTDKKDFRSMVASGNLGDTRVIVFKPQTYMNLSGEAVAAVLRFYKIKPENLVVVHDELDVPFGQIRTRIGGGSAGHNGIKSIIQHIGEGFGRVRIGIKSEAQGHMDSADFVLARFSEEEKPQLDNLKREVAAILSEYSYGGNLPLETRSFIV